MRHPVPGNNSTMGLVKTNNHDMADGKQNLPLVVDLSDQIVNNSMQSVLNESRMQEGESRTFESHARERELVKRSIERARKQLQQIVLADLGMNPVDISLVKKYKTVDVPAVHSAVGNIQKSLQKYVKFPGFNLHLLLETGVGFL